LLEQYSESFKINAEGKSSIMNLGPSNVMQLLRLYMYF